VLVKDITQKTLAYLDRSLYNAGGLRKGPPKGNLLNSSTGGREKGLRKLGAVVDRLEDGDAFEKDYVRLGYFMTGSLCLPLLTSASENSLMRI